MFGGYWAEGARERTEEIGDKRREILDEFEQWKKDNPYATLQELTEASQRLGGTNILYRNSMPTQDQLKQTSDRNKAAHDVYTRNNRQKAANAYSEWAKQNPHLTIDDFTKQRDLLGKEFPELSRGLLSDEVVKNLHKQNTAQNYAANRQEFINQNDAKNKNIKGLQDSLYSYYTETGDIKTAINRLRSDINTNSGPFDELNRFETDMLNSSKDYLDNLNLDIISGQFDQRYFNDNKDFIESQIEAGAASDDIAKQLGGQGIVNSTGFKGRVDKLAEQRTVKGQKEAFSALRELMADPNYINYVGAGGLEGIRKALGGYSDYLKDHQIEDYVKAQQDTVFNKKQNAARAASLQHAEPLIKANTENLNSYLGGIGKEMTNMQSQVILRQFVNSHNYVNENVISSLTRDLASEGDDISPEKLTQILDKHKDDGFMSNAAYKNYLQQNYMSTQALNKPRFQTDYLLDNLGNGQDDKGQVGKVLDQYQDNVKKLLSDTASFTNLDSRKHQRGLGSGEYNFHLTAINNTISELSAKRDQVLDIVGRVENPANFYGTVKEDHGKNVQIARSQGEARLAEIDGMIEQLREKQASIQVQSETLNRRIDGLATATDYQEGTDAHQQLMDFAQQLGFFDKIKDGQDLSYEDKANLQRFAGFGRHPLQKSQGSVTSNRRMNRSKGGSYENNYMYPGQGNITYRQDVMEDILNLIRAGAQ